LLIAIAVCSLSAMTNAPGQARKTKLAPHIKELRSVRLRYEGVEGEYSQRKKVYDALVQTVQGWARPSLRSRCWLLSQRDSIFTERFGCWQCVVCYVLRSERIKLEQDVTANQNGILEDVPASLFLLMSALRVHILWCVQESQYHFLNCLGLITQAKLEQGRPLYSFMV
jgi:hypothetical protein